MKCKATRAGFYKHFIDEGEVFDWPGKKPPSWAEPLESKASKSSEGGSDDGESAEMKALREKAKELGYDYWHNAGKKKLKKFIAEAEAEAGKTEGKTEDDAEDTENSEAGAEGKADAEDK